MESTNQNGKGQLTSAVLFLNNKFFICFDVNEKSPRCLWEHGASDYNNTLTWLACIVVTVD